MTRDCEDEVALLRGAPSPRTISSACFARTRRVSGLALRWRNSLRCDIQPAGSEPLKRLINDRRKFLPLEFTQRPDELIMLLAHGSRQRGPARSEEHTSELQSRFDLVC